ncbi:hypothetical protein SAMN05216421_1991 [Halopseudomonas xinjiangensis]|uniref:Uncharacterized protein n=1 Tax=Halopseudomonas xinjiangensis TaxID=487184 RepID=A0A1H1U8Q3_9GAMM|nr:hypothetical protein [Halopseudomonas xinjiangensis]SDS68868.1 hypothetical protein SAMN05216421_1991 [Halopseudomonas xinjiangensis]
MLIPGLPPVGAQNDTIKRSREIQPTARSEVVHEAAAEPAERRRRDRGRFPDRRRRRRAGRLLVGPDTPVETITDMPAKGLLVDIEV